MASIDCEAIRAREMPTFNRSYFGPDQRPYGAFIDMVIFWHNVAWLLAGLGTFACAKYLVVPRTHPLWRYLEVRLFAPILLVHLGALVALVCATLIIVVPFNTFPCWISMAMVLAPALVQVPPSVRLYTFYRQYSLNKAAAASGAIMDTSKQAHARKVSVASVAEPKAEESLPLSSLIAGIWLPSRIKLPIHRSDASSTIDSPGGGKENNRDLIENQKYVKMIKVTQLFASRKGTLIIMFSSMLSNFILFFALVGASEFARSGCNTCPLAEQPALRYSLYAAAVVPFVFCVVSVLLVRQAPDPLYVVSEIKLAFFAFGLPTIVFLILAGYTFRGAEDFNFRMVYQMFLLLFCLTQSALPGIVVMYWYWKSQRSMNAVSGTEDQRVQIAQGRNKAEFEAMLKDPVLHDAFMDHLIAEHSVESLRFHDEVQKWIQDFADVNPRTAQVRARKIVTLFVGEDAVFPINLPYETIHTLRESVGLDDRKSKQTSFRQNSKRSLSIVNAMSAKTDVEAKPIDRTFFDEADKQICELMRLDGFARFETTKRYKQLKAESLAKAMSTPGRMTTIRTLRPVASMEAIVPAAGAIRASNHSES